MGKTATWAKVWLQSEESRARPGDLLAIMAGSKFLGYRCRGFYGDWSNEVRARALMPLPLIGPASAPVQMPAHLYLKYASTAADGGGIEAARIVAEVLHRQRRRANLASTCSVLGFLAICMMPTLGLVPLALLICVFAFMKMKKMMGWKLAAICALTCTFIYEVSVVALLFLSWVVIQIARESKFYIIIVGVIWVTSTFAWWWAERKKFNKIAKRYPSAYWLYSGARGPAPSAADDTGGAESNEGTVPLTLDPV